MIRQLQVRRQLLLYLLLILVFFFPYMVLWLGNRIPFQLGLWWWSYIVSSVSIYLIGRQLWQKEVLYRLGLRMSWRTILGVLLLTIAFAIPVRILIFTIITAHNVGFDPESTAGIAWIFPFFQALNEEIVFRSLILTWLARFGRMRAALLSSFLFAGAHWFFYWIYEGVSLPFTSLITLFAFAMTGALLFLRYHHIGYGYALHLGWNLTQVEGDFYGVANGKSFWLPEGTVFALLEGAPLVMLISLLILAITLWIWLRQPPQEKETAQSAESTELAV